MSRIRTNTAALTVSFFATAAFYFVQLKIITNFLSQTQVGAWTAVTATALLLIPFAELGMAQVLVRYGAKYEAEGRAGRLVGLFVLSLKVLAGGALVAAGVLLLTGPSLAEFLGKGDEEINRWLLLLGFAALTTGSLRALNNAALRGLRRMPAMAGLEIGFGALVTVGYFLFRDRLDVGMVFVLWGAASLGVAVSGMVYLVRQFRALPPIPRPEGSCAKCRGSGRGRRPAAFSSSPSNNSTSPSWPEWSPWTSSPSSMSRRGLRCSRGDWPMFRSRCSTRKSPTSGRGPGVTSCARTWSCSPS